LKGVSSLAIDRILRDGLAFNPGANQAMEAVRSAIRALFEELERREIEYLLVGGVALLSYVEGRNTQDIDLILDPADLDKLPWHPTVRDRDFGEADFQGIHVDLLLTTNPLFRHVLATERTLIEFGEAQVPCATREGLLLLKLYALPSLYRQGKLARAALYETDILMLHQDVRIDDDQLLAVLAGHLAPHDVDELGKILEEQRARRRFL
jgi:hypothetical protein